MRIGSRRWWIGSVGLLALLAGVAISGSANASEWGLPQYVYQDRAVHPVDYWWYFEPQKRAAWDYYGQVPDANQSFTVTSVHRVYRVPPVYDNGLVGYANNPAFHSHPYHRLH